MHCHVDFSHALGPIKPLHGVGQPPAAGSDFSLFHYLTEAGVPYSRLHDVGGMYGGGRWVDIPNLFRNFDADPEDPASYDFTFTDLLITALMEAKVEPYFRLGVTIENDSPIKAYYIYPPADFHKWAVICEHVIRHYTEGWANGFHYNIQYWEIWNEPDNQETIEKNHMWLGSKEQYYELYCVTAKHLKSCFPHLKIGGYGSCGFYSLKKSFIAEANSTPRYDYFIEFLDGFIDYIKAENAPLDFFSWHSYDNVENSVHYAKYAKQRLVDAGYPETEMSCNEWNFRSRQDRGTYRHAAEICAMMLSFQNLPVDNAMFYDARFGTSQFGSLFHPLTAKPFPAYYALTAFNRLYQAGTQVALEMDDTPMVYAVAAKKEHRGVIVFANQTAKPVPLTLTLNGRVTGCLLTAHGQNEGVTTLPDALPPESILTVFAEI